MFKEAKIPPWQILEKSIVVENRKLIIRDLKKRQRSRG
jgi:hypothetical protein